MPPSERQQHASRASPRPPPAAPPKADGAQRRDLACRARRPPRTCVLSAPNTAPSAMMTPMTMPSMPIILRQLLGLLAEVVARRLHVDLQARIARERGLERVERLRHRSAARSPSWCCCRGGRSGATTSTSPQSSQSCASPDSNTPDHASSPGHCSLSVEPTSTPANCCARALADDQLAQARGELAARR